MNSKVGQKSGTRFQEPEGKAERTRANNIQMDAIQVATG